MHSGRKRCMAWCSKQFFTNKAAFEPNEQVVDQGRVGLGDASQFNPIASQGPVPFARLVVQTFTLEGSLFSTKPNKSFVFQQRLGEDFFPFDRLVWFLSSQPSFFVVQCSHYFWQRFRLWISQFSPSYLLPVLETKKPFGQCLIKYFNDGLIPMNLGTRASYDSFVAFRLFRYNSHEFFRGVNLQHFGPFQRIATIDYHESFFYCI